jgi:hypothetical protein
MANRILQTCGGFALAFFGCVISLHGNSVVGLLIAVGGVAVCLNSLDRNGGQQ